MNYLITGGAGFIGSHLTKRLLDYGNRVIVVDDFSMGKFSNLDDRANLIIVADSIGRDVGSFFENIDVVFHLAAMTRPRESFGKPVETTRVNVEGTLKVILNCAKNHVKKLVFVSSATVYGFQDKFPFREDAKLNPASPYGLTKLVGENYCKFFGKAYGLTINRIRPFNVYGRGQDPKGGYAAAVPKFIDSLKKGTIPHITGDGTQKRDFIYIDDVIDLMLLLASSDVSGEVFNAGSGTSTSINDLFTTIADIMRVKVKPDYIVEINEPQTQADITKAKALLGWQPKVGLVEGLERTINA